MPTEASDRTQLAGKLRQFAGIHPGITSLPNTQVEKLPVDLGCVLREDYISSLSEEFSRASHEGDYAVAFNAGLTLLALYVVIYPPNYPQIGKLSFACAFLLDENKCLGVHMLELAKSAWNAQFLADMTDIEEKIVRERVRTFLRLSSKVLTIYGPEGDGGGPMSEIGVLENLLSRE